MSYQNIIVEREDNIAILTVNRPTVLNALNNATVGELDSAFDELGADANVRAIIMTGAGEKSFVAGADINELRALTSSLDAYELVTRGHNLLRKIENMRKPVIMAVNGYALGGGCEIAMAGDIRLAADTARLGVPEINLGLFPGYGGTQRLPRLVGKSRAKLMMLTGDAVDAQEAFRIGLVDKIVPAAELMQVARDLAKKLAAKPPVALQLAKQCIDQGIEMDVERALAYERAQSAIVQATEDRVEGTSAFLEKRKPQWKGR